MDGGGRLRTSPAPDASLHDRRRPTPPGGATVRVFEEKREEEAAPEQSSAYAIYRADEHSGTPDTFLYGLVLLAALAGTSIAAGSRRRQRRSDFALADTRTSVRHRPTARRRP